MIARTFLKTLTLAAFFVAVTGSGGRADETQDKIAELKKRRENISTLHSVATSVARSPSETRESRIEIWDKYVDGKPRYKRWITAVVDPGTPKEQAASPSLMVKDGVTAWREVDTGEQKIVFTGKAERRTEYYDIEKMLHKGVAKISDGGKHLDEACVLLEVREKANPEDIIASYWISEKHGLVLKSIVKTVKATTEMKVTEYKLGEEIANSIFTYQAPANTQVIDEKSGSSQKID